MERPLVVEAFDEVVDLIRLNEACGCQTYRNFHRSPDDLTATETHQALLLAKVCAEGLAYFESFNQTLPAPLRYDKRPAGLSGLLDQPLTPLPPALDTRVRRIHDALHMLILDGSPSGVALRQFGINERLRREGEFTIIIEVITILNHVTRQITGKTRFMMNEEYSLSIQQQISQLVHLRTHKPALHRDILQALGSRTGSI